MRLELDALVKTSNCLGKLASFWARALQWDISATANGDFELIPTDATGFRLAFRNGAEPKGAQNPIHFDLTSESVDHQQSFVADLIAHGAQPADVGQAGDEGHVVLADPEGNELCVIEPENLFLAGCPRLGTVNCDGTKELGSALSSDGRSSGIRTRRQRSRRLPVMGPRSRGAGRRSWRSPSVNGSTST